MRRCATWVVLCCASCSSPGTSAPDSDLRPSDGRAPAIEGSLHDRGAPIEARSSDGARRDVLPPAKDQGPPPTCPANPLAAGDHDLKINFGGHSRAFTLHVPKGLKAGSATPLVVDFHGFTSDSFQQRWISGFLAESDASGFVVAHPNGYGPQKSWNAGALCCGQAVADKLDDVGLAKAIVKEISAKVCIDSKRVYATGISNGGMLSHRLACEASSVFAAVAPVAGRIDLIPITSCQPGRPVPVIAFHGQTDELVPYQDAKNAIAHWVKVNGCTDPGSVTYTKGKASCTTYSSCSAATKVSFCTLTAGHISYWNTDNVPIATVGWEFLSKFTLP